MVKMIMHGCNGAMGRAVTGLVAEDAAIEIVAGIDISDGPDQGYPVFGSLENCPIAADVVVDFASAGAADALLDYCEAHRLPLVLCTTGLEERQLKRVKEAGSRTAILHSANMSLGVNLLLKLVKDAAAVLAESGFDIELVEKHHNRKKDAPSGTALALADSINDAMGRQYHYVCGRSSAGQARDSKEIGISSVRGGTIVGQHDVIFAGTDEMVTLSHTAYSKAIFAKGAVAAAKFLAGKGPGLYDMKDVIGLQSI